MFFTACVQISAIFGLVVHHDKNKLSSGGPPPVSFLDTGGPFFYRKESDSMRAARNFKVSSQMSCERDEGRTTRGGFSRRVASVVLASVIVAGSSVVFAVPANASNAASTGASDTYGYLGSAGSYAVLAGAAITVPGSKISGDVGAGAAETLDDGFSITDGALYATTDTHTTSALNDAAAAYATFAGMTAGTELVNADLGGLPLFPGVSHSVAALAATDTVTFDAQGDPDAVFVIQTDAALDTTAATTMLLVNGAKAENIYWVTAGAVTLGASSQFVGTILSNAAVTVGAGSTIEGRAVSVTAAVTLDANTIIGGNEYNSAP